MSRPSPPVLLLHGQPGSAADWTQVVAALGNESQTIALDRPGWDGTIRATDLPGNAEAAVDALDRQHAPCATVVGHSFGAGVAAWIAVRYPERVRALVLAAPAANTASLTHTDQFLARAPVGPLVSSGILASTGAALRLEPLRHSLVRRLRLDDRQLLALGRLLAAPAAWRAFAVEQRALVRQLPQLDAELARIAVPTVIVAGAHDRIVPATAARALATQIPGAELVLLAGAGHLLPHRHAERLAAIIEGVGGRTP